MGTIELTIKSLGEPLRVSGWINRSLRLDLTSHGSPLGISGKTVGSLTVGYLDVRTGYQYSQGGPSAVSVWATGSLRAAHLES